MMDDNESDNNPYASQEAHANINFDNMRESSQDSPDSDQQNNGMYYSDPALQLLEGDEMNAAMANFIGIHMLNELPQEG